MTAIKYLIATGCPNTASPPVMLTSAGESYGFQKKKRKGNAKNLNRKN